MHRICSVAVLALIGLTWFLSGVGKPCHAAPAPNAETAFVEFRQLAVMPFFAGSRRPAADESVDRTLSCPVGELCADASEIAPGAARSVARMVTDDLRMKFGAQVVSQERSQDAYAEALIDESSQTPRRLAQELGRRLDADYVVVGTVWRFRDRGQMPGVPDSPASVAFALYLVDVKTGRRVWRGVFDETQRPLTDNLLQARQSLKMGVKWLSARELARFGVQQVMKSFPSEEDLRIPVPVQ